SSVLIGGRTLAYDVASPANPADARGTILLLTGLASKRLGWARQLEVFGREYRTIAMDHRDTGDSDEVADDYTAADLADDAAALLETLGITRAHVVGISLGGFVALHFALRHADLLDKLVLVSTSAGGSTHVPPSPEIVALLTPDASLEVGERAIRNYSRIMAAEYVAAHPEEMERIAETARYRPQSPAAYMRQLRASLAHDVTDALHRITAPTLVIHGDLDPLVPAANGEYLAKNIAGARHVVYHGVGHIPIVERADEFNRDVLAFLAASIPSGSETEAREATGAAEARPTSAAPNTAPSSPKPRSGLLSFFHRGAR
ncbi:MAG TPA: alpha/beta fold hydrolase, partial [Ktedonobacterales bacterium]|nr:alpha/beta fold hydrolase [Ktedonobacterales bacterium]